MKEELNNTEQQISKFSESLRLASQSLTSFEITRLGDVETVVENFNSLDEKLKSASESLGSFLPLSTDVEALSRSIQTLSEALYSTSPEQDNERVEMQEQLSLGRRKTRQKPKQEADLSSSEQIDNIVAQTIQRSLPRSQTITDKPNVLNIDGKLQNIETISSQIYGAMGGFLGGVDIRQRQPLETISKKIEFELIPLTPRIRQAEAMATKPEAPNPFEGLEGSLFGGGNNRDGGGETPAESGGGRENIFVIGAILGILNQLKDTVSEFQAAALSRGFEKPMSVLNNSISNNIPAMTELRVSTTLLKTGLEENSGRVAEYIARSQLLGENSLQLATSIRSLTSTMGLTASEQGALVKSIADSSVKYKISSDELAMKISSLTEKIGLVTVTGDQSTIKAFAKLEAMVGRVVPEGTLDKTFAPMMTGDLGVVGAAGFIGAEEERKIIANISNDYTEEQKFTAMMSMLEKTVAKGEEIGGYSGDVNLLRSITAGPMGPLGGSDFFINARAIQNAATRPRTEKEERDAKLADANLAIIAIGDRLYEPLALAGQSLLKLIELFPTISSGLIQLFVASGFIKAITGIYTFTSKIPSLLSRAVDLLGLISRNTSVEVAQGAASSPAAAGTGFFQNLLMEGEIGISKTKSGLKKARSSIASAPRRASAAARRGLGAARGGLGAARSLGVAGAAAGAARTAGVAAVGVGRVAAMGVGRLAGALFGGPVGIALTALTFLPSIYDGIFGIKENTDKIKENTVKDPPKPLQETARQSLINQASLISQVSNETVRTSMLLTKTDRADIMAQHSQLQLDRLGQIVDRLTEIKDKRSALPDRMSKSVKD